MATQYTAGLTNGEVLTSATMNSIGAAWESYTPSIKTGATTLTGTLQYAKYAQINKTVWVQIGFLSNSAGGANQIISISYPSGLGPANNSGYRVLGAFSILDSGTAFYIGAATVFSSTVFAGTAYGSTNYMGAAGPTMTIASGDYIQCAICYEVA